MQRMIAITALFAFVQPELVLRFNEMGSVTLSVVAAREAEFTALQDGYRLHIGAAVLKKFGGKK